jgi:hypothetical protein
MTPRATPENRPITGGGDGRGRFTRVSAETPAAGPEIDVRLFQANRDINFSSAVQYISCTVV